MNMFHSSFFARYRFLFIILLSFALNAAIGQSKTPIVLQDEKPHFTPGEFFIAGVSDEQSNNQTENAAGAAKALRRFVSRNLSADTTLHPVVLTIKQLDISETTTPYGNINGHIALLISFGLKREFDTVKLVNYKGGITYTAPALVDNREPNLRRVVWSALSWFNNWMNKQADANPLLAKRVELTFADFTEKPEGDTIYYSPKRPITWDDFQGEPVNDRYEAEVFVSMGYSEYVEVVKGIIHVNLTLKTYFPKSAAWARPSGRTDNALNHEQRHFDIVKIITERFKQTLSAAPLTVANYDGPINVEYLEALRQAYAMQTQYDKETAHGTNGAAQEYWDRHIDKQLQRFRMAQTN